MHYYLYEIKNNLNGKIYIGVHKTKSLDDGYMGSGKVIKNAIDKNGIENFSKTILETFDDVDSMFKREKEIVTEEFLLREDVYNLRCGGYGGFDFINSSGITKFHGKTHSDASKLKMAHFGNKHGVGNQGGKKNKGMKREQIQCPYCLKECAINMYPRYHGNNCKIFAGKVLLVA